MSDVLGLDVAVDQFVAQISPLLSDLLAQLPDRDPATARLDVTTEAFALVCAVIDSDELATDPELWALLRVFGPRIDSPLLRSTPSAIRDARLLRGKRTWLDRPSTLFEILAGMDARDGGTRARTYLDAALRIAYLVAAVDAHPGRTELLAIERYRGMLSRTLADAPASPPADGTGDPQAQPQSVETDGPEDEPRPLDELYRELDGLIGLAGVKEEIRLVAALTQIQALREERGLPTTATSRHLVFTGNPGTGKTTVARLLAQIYRTLGVVEHGHLVEVDRAGLVAGFVGQTATKVTEVFDRADGGVLLIDEAYALVRGSEADFGREAIDTIVKLVEDRRDRIVVIIAGYPAEMAALVAANPGMRSRFARTIEFDDYTDDELIEIFSAMCDRHHYIAGDGVLEAVGERIGAVERGTGFGNGRVARNLFEEAIARHARRVVEVEAPSDSHLVTLDVDDLVVANEGTTR